MSAGTQALLLSFQLRAEDDPSPERRQEKQALIRRLGNDAYDIEQARMWAEKGQDKTTWTQSRG